MQYTPLFLTLSLCLALGVVACSSQAPQRPQLRGESIGVGNDAVDGNTPGKNDPSDPTNSTGPDNVLSSKEPKLSFQLGDIQHDGSDFTFGSMKVISKNPMPLELKTKRFLSLKDPSSLKAEEKAALSKLCRDIELSHSASAIEAAKDSGNSGDALHVFWRSYYPAGLKTILADLITAGEDIACVLKVESTDEGDILPYFLVFDPIPADASLIGGSARTKDAIARGLMMPVLKKKAIDEKTLVAIDAEPEILIAVPALTKESVKVTAEAGMSASCLLHPTKPGTVVNPDQALSSKANLESMTNVVVGQISPVAIDGRLLKSCDAIKPKEAAKKFETGLTCDIYQKIKNEGIEAGCQWDVELINEKDPSNSVAARIGLDKVTFNTFNIRQVDSSLNNIPKSAKNPVVTKAINFRNFNEKQLKSMEQVFDLWLAVEPKSYDEDVHNFMKNITREACQGGVLGYAGLRSANFTICDLASLSDAALNKVDDPLRPIIQLITTAHEVRHAVKWQHDFDNTSYQPCEGSAASAVTMYAIAGKCDLDYCLVLKNMAIREFRAELNYSLGNDRRKGQGQCKAWTDELGVTL